MQRMCCCVEMASITCYQSTWSHLVDQKALETNLVCFRIGLVTISQTWEFLTPVYLYLLVCNFAVKLAFVPNLLAIVFAIKVWCQFHPHSVYIQLYHIYKGSWSRRKVIWQVIISSFLLKHVSSIHGSCRPETFLFKHFSRTSQGQVIFFQGLVFHSI